MWCLRNVAMTPTTSLNNKYTVVCHTCSHYIFKCPAVVHLQPCTSHTVHTYTRTHRVEGLDEEVQGTLLSCSEGIHYSSHLQHDLAIYRCLHAYLLTRSAYSPSDLVRIITVHVCVYITKLYCMYICVHVTETDVTWAYVYECEGY